MKTLFKNGTVINVFTGETQRVNVLIEDKIIIGVGDYHDDEAEVVKDINGKYICPGFIDGHIHIESSMLCPGEFARVSVPHGTTSVVADPHEIANVCGVDGIKYMLDASENIPMTVYVVLPSCVPATKFCESGAVLEATNLEELYNHPRVIGLGEVMNYIGVINGDSDVLNKIESARSKGLIINGHAPLLTGKALDKYILTGIGDDHECSNEDEAKERICKGQYVMIRQGTAARNLGALLPLFDEPWAQRCMLVTDDKHPADLINNGHIDDIIRQAVRHGKSAITGIRMATIRAAEYFKLEKVGAIAPGYVADILILDDLKSVKVNEVYKQGVCVASKGKLTDAAETDLKNNRAVLSDVNESAAKIYNTFNMKDLTAQDFLIEIKEAELLENVNCRVISLIKNELITDEKIMPIDFSKNNGIDKDRDILKIAVAERHNDTGHIGLSFIHGVGIKSGAIASSVSHDSHNLIIIGTNEEDMAFAGNRLKELGGGCIVVDNGKVISEMPLPLAGLMTDKSAKEIAGQNEEIRKSVHELGAPEGYEPFMTMAFVSLPVIPHLKITSKGLVDVNKQEIVSLFVDENTSDMIKK